ncbi:MAG: 3-deoxy-D-manno-octulosonic acid transferase [Williamsia sp.]|nr:3-deoxy-D-manno-octulosonic acid transferase [Williamsia sp.]
MKTAIYFIALKLYYAGIVLVSPWNEKARLWLRGRRGTFTRLRTSINRNPGQELVWMHCASLGEFEQGRPLLEAVRDRYPQAKILLTFFSSSGYEIRKNYDKADLVFYLPLDTPLNARRFLSIVQPALVLWIKYEYWYFYFREIQKAGIPFLLISAIFRKEQLFFHWHGSLHRDMLRCFTHLFVQTPESARLLGSIGISGHTSVTGDTRFDRVIEIAGQFEPISWIEDFCAGHLVIVAGSTWDEDEEELDHFANTHPELRFIVAPHEIHAAHLKDIFKLFKHAVLYSEYRQIKEAGEGLPERFAQANVLVIDNIGMLARLYRYATITYVGGGFGESGVHNILEAAVYGKPVVFGPVYDKYAEAEELLESGGAFSIRNAIELEKILNRLLHNYHEYRQVCEASQRYVYAKSGAKQKIMDYISANKLLGKQAG